MDPAPARAPRRSRRVLKYTFIALSALSLTLGAVIVYIAATFDPRELHPRAIDLVREKTGRTLEIRGQTALSFWPDVGVRLSALSLSERASSETFASIEGARVTLKLLPLLKRELVATELSITGANVRVTRDGDGRLNIADLFAGEGGPPRFDIGRVAIERSTLTYRDLASGAQFELGAIALQTGRLANGVATPLTLAGVLTDASGAFRVQAKLKTRLELDLEQQRYALGAAHLEANGNYGQEAIAVTVDAGSLTFAAARMHGEGVRLTLLAKGPAGTTEAKLDLPAVKRDGERIDADAAAFEVTLQRGDHRVHATVSTPLEAVLPTRELRLTAVDAALTVHGPRLPRNGLVAGLKGEANLDAGKEGVQVRLAGKIADSRVKIQLAAAGFASPVYTFAVDIDQVDLDRYASGEAAARKPSPATHVKNLLDPLEGLPASGTLTIGVLKSAGVKATNVKLALR